MNNQNLQFVCKIGVRNNEILAVAFTFLVASFLQAQLMLGVGNDRFKIQDLTPDFHLQTNAFLGTMRYWKSLFPCSRRRISSKKIYASIASSTDQIKQSFLQTLLLYIFIIY
jgi:hypothetical protein